MTASLVGQISAVRVDSVNWRTTSTLEMTVRAHGADTTFVIPAGYLTDFASVPRITAWLIPRTGDYTPAAVAHDWLLSDALADKKITSCEVDDAFREIMRSLGVPWARRWLMWAGVRWAAVLSPLRRPGWLRDLPMVLLVSLCALPFVLPGVIGVGVSLILILIFSLFAPREQKVNSLRT
ncbi:DUF1353 domain-containing protein [Actinophytocola sp.]|uniref:DUF1353 domain-containing protein n=1 Tax=Actinophytocola sp. TaxID=1872138 RepID=UPI003D6AE553